MSDVEEVQLPGVGVRLDYTTSFGEKVAVLVHRGGRRELMVYDKDDPDQCSTVLQLSVDDTHTLSELLRRDLAKFLPFSGSGAALPVIFFLAVAMLYPFALGPDATLLARTGGGVLWIAALLAAILPLDRLVAEDIALGTFDQMKLRGMTDEAMMAVRMVAHWTSFGPPLILATFPAAALLALEPETLRLLLIGLAAGTPGLAAIGLIIAALTASLRAGAALSGLLLIPLALPIRIFGAGALARTDAASIGFVAAISLLLVAIAPFAAGAAIRAAREA